jgi:tetratricopeptide (TPR) repeat protein
MIRRLFAILLAVGLLSAASRQSAYAQAGPTETIVVLPFENRSDHPEFNWIGESFADRLSTLLTKPGLVVITNDERAVAYQRLHLPLTVLPSRATAIKIARELKASIIVIGNFNVTVPAAGGEKSESAKSLATIAGEARVVRINEGRMAGDIFDGAWAPRVYDFGGTVTDLQKMNGELAYQVLAQRDKALSFSRQQLIAEATRIPPQAWEAYSKGLLTPQRDPTRAVYLKNAMKLYAKEHGGAVYSDAAFALGEYYFNLNQLKEAAEYLTMVQKKEPHYGEAQFYAGLSYWKLGEVKKAVDILVPLADERVMPLVAVFNNAAGVLIEAAKAEKKPEEKTRLLLQAITLLSRAADSSPDDSTVLFNFGYALFLAERYPDAAQKLEKVIAGNPQDGHAYFLLAKTQERAGQTEPATAADNQARRYMEGSYAKWQTEWQKSQTVPNVAARSRDVLNQIDVAMVNRTILEDEARADNTEQMLTKIRELYQQGRDDEAMIEIRKLMVSEPTNAEAFLLSGQINQRRGDQEAAIAALKTAIFWEHDRPIIASHILLGRIFLERGDLGEARKYAASAMAIDANNQEAIALQRAVTLGRP